MIYFVFVAEMIKILLKIQHGSGKDKYPIYGI